MKQVSPILIITFNRPDYLSQLLDVVQSINTSCLYIYRDGSRTNNEADIIAEDKIRKLLAERKFSYPIKTNFSPVNNGCGYGPYNAISWAFMQENELIILEDDCIPSPVFFDFCTDMLDRYRGNENIRLISGRSHMSEHPIFRKYDYIYSQYAHTLGWATWKRTWEGFDMKMKDLPEFLRQKKFYNLFANKEEADFMQSRYKRLYKDENLVSHSWDMQFGYHCRKSGALGIVPSKNLVKNIGCIGTHPGPATSYIYQLNAETEFSYIHFPDTISLNREYEYVYFRKFVYTPKINILKRVKNKIIRLCK